MPLNKRKRKQTKPFKIEPSTSSQNQKKIILNYEMVKSNILLKKFIKIIVIYRRHRHAYVCIYICSEKFHYLYISFNVPYIHKLNELGMYFHFQKQTPKSHTEKDGYFTSTVLYFAKKC